MFKFKSSCVGSRAGVIYVRVSTGNETTNVTPTMGIPHLIIDKFPVSQMDTAEMHIHSSYPSNKHVTQVVYM
jgi:hypothetical protein